MMAWHKIIQEMNELVHLTEQNKGVSLNKYSLDEEGQATMVEKYGNILKKRSDQFSSRSSTVSGVMEALITVIQHQAKHLENKHSTLFQELSLIMNTILLENDLRLLLEQIEGAEGGKNVQHYEIKLTSTSSEKIELRSEEELSVEMSYEVKVDETKNVSVLLLQSQALLAKA